MATAVAEPPVRLVKLIGDAAMLVSTEAGPMVEAALRTGRGGRAGRRRVPAPARRARLRLRPAPQSGDYYGRPVNLASRLTAIAKPGSVLVDAAAKEAAGEGFDLLLRRRAPPEGLRLPRQALPGAPRRQRASAACGRRRAGCRRARPAGGARAGGCRPSAGRCSCGRRSCASPRGPSRARRSTRPCAGPSPRRWRAAPRRRRGAPRSRPRASRRRRSAGAKAWTSTSPSRAWPLDCSASGTARRRARTSSPPDGGDDQPGPLRQRGEAVAVARGLAAEGDRRRPGAARGGIRRRRARGRGCGAGPRGRRRGRSSRPRRAGASASVATVSTSSPSAAAVPREPLQHSRRDVGRGQPLDQRRAGAG